MNVTITDPEVLSALGTRQIAAYLRSRYWKLAGRYFDTGTAWVAADERTKLVLPLFDDLEDYAESIADILTILARYEKRSQSQVLRDINEATKDIIRVHLSGNDLEEGAIPLEEAAHLVGHARDMLMAAACSTVQPRSLFTGRKPTDAVEYMRHVRMGQTERGSFILTMQSEVPPQLTSGQQNLFPDVLDSTPEPFPRRVTRTLAQALWEMHTALADTLATGQMDRFFEARDAGVSANLCDAVAGLTLADHDRDIAINLSWSPTRLVPNNTPSRISFPSDRLPLLREVARVLREKSTYEAFELSGPVVKLERPEGAAMGMVTVAGVVENRARRVAVELWGEDHELAIEAYRTEATLFVEGELQREGSAYRLKNPRRVAIESAS